MNMDASSSVDPPVDSITSVSSPTSPSELTHVPITPGSEVILEEVPIGRGGYGTVYRGKHTNLGIVAVKTLIENGMLPDK